MDRQALPHSGLVPRKERFGWAWTISIGLHVALFLGAAIGSSASSCGDGVDRNQKPIAAKLVRLGTPRDEKLLPRIPTAPPAPPATKTAPVVTPGDTKPVAEPSPIPTPPKPQETSKPVAAATPTPPTPPASRAEAPKDDGKQKLDDIMKRFATGTRVGEAQELPGQLDGDPMGDAENAEEGERYLALVIQRLRSQWVMPTAISAEERIRLTAVVTLWVERNGSISRHQISQPSGNGLFDAALESAVQRSSPLPPPPDHLVSTFRRGVAVTYKP